MSNDTWRWAEPNGQQRRVRIDELRASLASGVLAPNTPVWKPGWSGWRPAHEVPELTTSALSAANGVVPNIPPPPLAVVAVQHAYEAKSVESFRPPAIGAEGGAGDEPPPPPAYIPAPTKPSSLSPPAFQSAPPPPPSSQRVAGGGPVAPGLPTTIGLPPPPELQAMAAQAAVARTKSPPIGAGGLGGPGGPGAGSGSGADPMIEELSGSVLLDESSAGPNGLPAPTDPIQSEMTRPSADSMPALPVRNPLHSLIRDVGELRAGRPPKNKRLLIVAGVLAGSTAILVLSLIVSAIGSLFSSKDEADASASDAASASASASASSETASATGAPDAPPKPAASAIPAPAAAKAQPAAAAGPSYGDCALAGDAKSLGWRAMVGAGVDLRAIAGGGLAIGFASSQRDGVAMGLDSSASPGNTVKARAPGEARRVTPMILDGKLVPVVDVDRRGDRLAGRRTIATSPPIDVGVAEKSLAWAPHGKNAWAKLFELQGEGPVEALRGVPLSTEKGIAVTFRRGGAIWVGVAKGEGALEPAGSLVELAGLGQVGSPSIATSGSDVIVAWADRSSPQDPWQVRWAKISPGGAATSPATLPMPEGGLGAQAMSPSVAGLGAGRFVAAWTEGAVSNHHVRVMSVNADGTVSGSAIAVSPAGMNAGQPDVVVGEDGHGAVAFLGAKGKGFEVHAAPLTCPPR